MSTRLVFALLAGLFAAPALAAPECPGKTDGSGIVADVLDGATIRLADGSEIRLAGIEPPSPARHALEARSVAALKLLLLGKKVELRHSSARPDRYGRKAAEVFLADPLDWVEAHLIGDGLSRVLVGREGRACTAALLGLEAEARKARRGLWKEPAFAIRQAEDASLREMDGLYVLVEGKILTVGRNSANIYLDFGRDWSTDFTVTIATADRASFEAAGKGATALRGRSVRVRGWVTQWNGATMRLSLPEEIEVLGGEGATEAGE